jgi:hypothetical protein
MLTLDGTAVEPETAETYRRIDGLYDVKIKLADPRQGWRHLGESWSQIAAAQAARIINRLADPAAAAGDAKARKLTQEIDLWEVRKQVQLWEKRYGQKAAAKLAQPRPVNAATPQLPLF